MPVEEYAPRAAQVGAASRAERATPVPEDVGVQEPSSRERGVKPRGTAGSSRRRSSLALPPRS